MRDLPQARGWLRVSKFRRGHYLGTSEWVGNAFTAHMWRSIVMLWAGLSDGGYPVTIGEDSQLTVYNSGGSQLGSALILQTGYPAYGGDYRALFLWHSEAGQQTGSWDDVYVLSPAGITMSQFLGVGLGSKGVDDDWVIEYQFRVI